MNLSYILLGALLLGGSSEPPETKTIADPKPVIKEVREVKALTPIAPAKSAGVSSCSLAYIREHESGGDYRAVNSAGYYGAYQFDQQTWESVGGSGRPDQASPEEQDRRAAMLKAQRGSSPWSVC